MQPSSTSGPQIETFMIPALGPSSLGSEARSPLDHGTVLVVDESLPVRAKLVEVLEKLGTAGGKILQATTPEEALAAFRAHRPQVVFAELIGVHPEDGLEVIHAMLDIDPATRVVLVSAEPRESAEVRAAVRAGVFAVIEQPLRAEKVRHVLQELEGEESAIERLR